MKYKISIKGMLALIYSITIVMLIAIIICSFALANIQKKVIDAEEVRYKSYLAADELRQSSDDLTRLARTYVTSMDPKYKDIYWDILKIRNGEKPRPQNYERIYWDIYSVTGVKPRPDEESKALKEIMKELNFTKEEFAQLTQAENNSNALVGTETIAMNAIDAILAGNVPEITRLENETAQEAAIRIMHDETYHVEKKKIMEPIDEFFKLLDERTAGEVQKLQKRSALMLWLIIGMICLLTVLILISLIIFNLFITKPLEGITVNLKQSSSHIEQASSQLSSSSQQIASGSAEQASQIEETTAAVEELNSMVKQNAQNSREAATLAREGSTNAEKGFNEMENMLSAMTEINKSSDEIKKVMKVIDDIAFQTNILALNAAVEAARAGEAGMGFAVVADEVKNLANRSSEAAKDTAEMIETTIKKSEKGLEIANSLIASFKDILTGASKASDMSLEVEKASGEQEKGLDQVSRAIIEFDKVVQANVSTSEETASSAEELNSQAALINNQLNDLILLVKGRAGLKGQNIYKSPPPAGGKSNYYHEEEHKQLIQLDDEVEF